MAKTKSTKPKHKKKNIKLIVLGAVVAVCLICVALGYVLPGSEDGVAKAGTQAEYLNTTYAEYLDNNGYETSNQIKDGVEVVVDINNFQTYSDDERDILFVEEATDVAVEEATDVVEEVTEVVVETADAESAVAIGTTDIVDSKTGEVIETVTGVQLDDRSNVMWTFEVPQTGYFNLKFNYVSVDGTTSNPQRELYIDGKLLYEKMKPIEFARTWENGDVKIPEKGGNEIRPEATEEFVCKDLWVSDTTMRTLSPYVFYLTEGKHTIALEANREPLQINEIVFGKAPVAPTYAEYIESHGGTEGKTYAGENIVAQAERYIAEDETYGTVKITKSSPSIGAASDYASCYTTPYHAWEQRLNVMGGSNWATAGDSITWTINVPEEGFYQITPRARQNTNRGIKSYRRVMINGEVPFREAEKIGFDYSSGFVNTVLSDSEGNALLFYLNEGENTITMDVVLGDFASALSKVEGSVLVLNTMYRKVVQITGTVPDTYIDYEIETKVGGITEDVTFSKTMEQQATVLNAVVDELVAITGEKGSGTIQIEKVARQCAQFAEEPDDVVDEISDFKSNISALGTWMLEISSMPLEIDSFTLSAPDAALKNAEPNGFVAAGNEVVRFLATFFVDDTQIASEGEVTKDAVKVWIASGRDQAQIIRSMIDNDYGKSVNLQLIPAGVLLPATLAGNGPDVSLANGQASVIDFAVRGALYDLSQFEDYDEFVEDMGFKPSAINTATYNGGIYGLPETQTFSVLFYRSDILEELELEVPRTWDEVEDAINVLHIENYDFYIPTSAIYSTMVYQYGGDMYLGAAGTYDPESGEPFDPDGKDYGIRSGLREEPAMQAFQKLTEFFTTYALPVSADFSNRFRTGEIPIGVADYTLFNTLEIFAPEIKGLWAFAPMPGYRDPETGEINNTVVSASAHTVMMAGAKNKDASWDFIKWWLSEDTQVDYGTTIESILGSGARYATANTNVLRQLPWAAEQADVIVEQFDNTKGIPDVPGYYMTGREIDYAFKGVVTDGQNPREALYLNVKEINDELTTKREEFHLSRYNEEGVIVYD